MNRLKPIMTFSVSSILPTRTIASCHLVEKNRSGCTSQIRYRAPIWCTGYHKIQQQHWDVNYCRDNSRGVTTTLRDRFDRYDRTHFLVNPFMESQMRSSKRFFFLAAGTSSWTVIVNGLGALKSRLSPRVEAVILLNISIPDKVVVSINIALVWQSAQTNSKTQSFILTKSNRIDWLLINDLPSWFSV